MDNPDKQVTLGTQDEDKQKKIIKHRKLKKMSDTDPTKNRG